MEVRCRPHRPSWILLVAVLAIATVFPACSEKKTDTALSIIPDMPPDLVEHLTSGDDSTLTAYARDLGWWKLLNMFWDMGGKLLDIPRDQLETNIDEIDEYMLRIANVLDKEFNYAKSRTDIEYFRNLPLDTRIEVLEKRREWTKTFDDKTMTLQDKIAAQQELLKFFQAHGDLYGIGSCHSALSALYFDVGDEAKAEKHLMEAYEFQSAVGNSRLVCQLLGVMGARYEQEGDVDSMVVCYDKALQIAKRSRIPGQTARIYSFYAGHYYREGRLALAHAMYQQAIDWCREFKGGEMEVRYILAAMTYYERLGCWDICEQNLARARLLEKRYGDELLDVQKLRLDRFDARIAMARGRVDQADAAYRRIKQPVDDLRYREDMIEMLFNWGQGLVDNHRPAAALPIIEEGWIRSQSEFVPDWTPRFALLKAEAQIDLGTLDNARVSIAGFDSLSANGNRRYTREWIRRDALLARLEYAAGHREAALGQVETGFVRLREAIGDLDPSVHSYLWIGEGEGLRDVVHDLVADDPALGYGAEMMWRCFYRDLGQRLASADSGDEAVRCAPKASSGSLKTDLAAASDQAVKRVTSREAIHCVYRVQRDEIWRWTVSGDGIRRDVIQITPSALADLVSSTYDRLSRDPKTQKLNSPLRRDLRRLGLLLLPDEVLAAVDTASKPLLLVTTDGFLGRMPFEAFDTAAKGGYAPLLLTHDVAYVRFTDPATEAPPVSNGVIVVNPRPSQEQLKRFPFRQELEQAEKEGRAMAEVDPAAKYFGGRTATKSRLKKSCRDASYFYFAVHTLRDPAVPYLVLIPLAADSLDTGPDAEYLDILDIRNCDLSRCRVAILSGCSSGAPYVALAGSGPSLGDAFLDSGSGAVIQTFWDVDDNDARNLMTAFVRLWKGTCLTEVKTLSEARRRAMMSSDGVRHPSSWASYSIKLSKL